MPPVPAYIAQSFLAQRSTPIDPVVGHRAAIDFTSAPGYSLFVEMTWRYPFQTPPALHRRLQQEETYSILRIGPVLTQRINVSQLLASFADSVSQCRSWSRLNDRRNVALHF